ncbi:hypothetical protein [Saccharopolyspora tripterygii]
MFLVGVEVDGEGVYGDEPGFVADPSQDAGGGKSSDAAESAPCWCESYAVEYHDLVAAGFESFFEVVGEFDPAELITFSE